jgi:hypothetical protein
LTDAEEWQAIFDERAAIREHDGGIDRVFAEVVAFSETVRIYCRTTVATWETAVRRLRRMGVR